MTTSQEHGYNQSVPVGHIITGHHFHADSDDAAGNDVGGVYPPVHASNRAIASSVDQMTSSLGHVTLNHASSPGDPVHRSSSPLPPPPPDGRVIDYNHASLPHHRNELTSNDLIESYEDNDYVEPDRDVVPMPLDVEFSLAPKMSTKPLDASIAVADVWTHKDLEHFKTEIKNNAPSNVLKLSHSETATIRVPTHAEGQRLHWEFSTDWYDIGFGLYFEWSVPETDAIVVNVAESEDEDEDDETHEEAKAQQQAIDGTGGAKTDPASLEIGCRHKEKAASGPPVDEILPVWRRDSHLEVQCGSHPYPGQGVYVLKFDNTYSLWRSKTLYYRVHYSDT